MGDGILSSAPPPALPHLHTAAAVLQGIRPGSTTQAPNAINERSHAAVTELERSFSSKSLAAPGVPVDQLGWA